MCSSLLHNCRGFHLCTLLDKVKDPAPRDWYASKSLEHGWSRSILAMQIETGAHARTGSAITNFEESLPPPQSDLAREALKDPYIFDFLNLAQDAQERDIEQALTKHITRFLLELGAGFAFVGRQYRLEVGGDEFFVDLLFDQLKLRCYVVVELKTTPFRPEYAGQLNFYLSAIDAQVKAPDNQPTIGLLLCREKNRLVAEYVTLAELSGGELTEIIAASGFSNQKSYHRNLGLPGWTRRCGRTRMPVL